MKYMNIEMHMKRFRSLTTNLCDLQLGTRQKANSEEEKISQNVNDNYKLLFKISK